MSQEKYIGMGCSSGNDFGCGDGSSRQAEPMIRWLVEKLGAASRNETRVAHIVVFKLETREFKILTRSHTPGSSPSSCEELTDLALKLRERVDLSPQQRYRLVGVGLSNYSQSWGTPKYRGQR